jgi:dihydroorotase
MKLLIKNGRVIDPASGRDEVADVAIAGDRIVAIGAGVPNFDADKIIDARGLIVAPGLIDLAARLREPGQEHAGLLESELAAAAAGGVTSLVCPPDTDPTLDEPGLVEMLKFRARKLSRCRLFPLGALTRGLQGEILTEMAELTRAGCVGFSQADVPLRDTLVLQRALLYAATYGYTVWLRPQDAWLGGGVAASGAVATRLGLSGVPVAAETIALHTIFELVRATGARVHLCRLSSASGVALLRAAKAEQRDRDALRAALADGTIDALVSDHMPVSADEKTLPFAEAVPGASGLELLLSLALHWGTAADGSGLQRALAAVTCEPARVLGSAIGAPAASAGRLVEGGIADVCVFDPAARWQVTPGALRSQGKHTPFAFERSGYELPGRVRATLVAGTLAYDAGA